ncbi:MAG: WG repeat-containing protein, partial [Prevotella sp.]|nr:WG repeat-containing protein [Prevotella sp.]
VIQNPEPCGFIEAGRCRGWKGKKLFAAKGSEFLNPVCYLNEQGDTIVPYGKYEYCGFDSIAPIGIVAEPHVGIVMINSKGEKLFEVMTIDNFQADDVHEGLYRILDDEGKIGYADTLGNVVIKPQFQCAWPFEGGRARVAYHGKKNSMDEHSEWESDEWFYIDKNGQRVDGH